VAHIRANDFSTAMVAVGEELPMIVLLDYVRFKTVTNRSTSKV